MNTPPMRQTTSSGTSPLARISEQDKAIWKDSIPKIVVAGLKRSGKSSILRVLFNKLSPHEANYMEPTPQPTFLPVSSNPLLNVRIAEIPGCWSWEENEQVDELFFTHTQSLILGIDSSSEDVAPNAISLAKRVIARAIKVNRTIHVDIFLTKIDANYRFDPDSVQSENNKANFIQSIVNKIGHLGVTAHCTSIFDTSIHDAFSQVIQRPLLANGKIEQIMDMIVTSCRLEKAVLFDLVSKISFGSDSRQMDKIALMQDMLEVVIDMTSIYGMVEATTRSSCSINLSNGEVLYMRLIEKNLALVCVVKSENFDKTFLLNHNIAEFTTALMKIVSV